MITRITAYQIVESQGRIGRRGEVEVEGHVEVEQVTVAHVGIIITPTSADPPLLLQFLLFASPSPQNTHSHVWHLLLSERIPSGASNGRD